MLAVRTETFWSENPFASMQAPGLELQQSFMYYSDIYICILFVATALECLLNLNDVDNKVKNNHATMTSM